MDDGGLAYRREVKKTPELDKIKTSNPRPVIEGVIDIHPLQKVPGTFMYGYFSTKFFCAWTGIDGNVACTSNDLTERRELRYRCLPIIALTATAMRGDRKKCLATGVSDFISKSVDTDSLLSLLCI